MAIDFNGTTDGYRTADGAVSNISGSLISMFSWGLEDDANAGTELFISTGNGSGAGSGRLQMRLSAPAVAGGQLECWMSTSSTAGQWDTDSDFAMQAWDSYGISIDTSVTPIANVAPKFYVAGALAASTVSTIPTGTVSTGADTVSVGENTNAGLPFNGKLARICVWNSILTAAEFADLNAGAPPTHIQPANLQFWVEGLNGELHELIQGADLVTGSSQGNYEHPIIMPGFGMTTPMIFGATPVVAPVSSGRGRSQSRASSRASSRALSRAA